MTNASTLQNMSPELLRVVERAQREPEGRFHSLAHRIDVPALERAYRRMRKDAAVGVDGVTKEAYGQDREVNLQDLHARMRAKRCRHQPIRRVHIPKEGGKTRPVGISTVISYCTSCSRSSGSGDDAVRSGDTLPAGLLDLGRERYAQAPTGAAASGELPAADPVVDRALTQSEAVRDVPHRVLAFSEQGR